MRPKESLLKIAAAAPLLFVLLAWFAGIAYADAPPAAGPPGVSPPAAIDRASGLPAPQISHLVKDGVLYRLAGIRPHYRAGRPVILQLEITNTTGQPLTFADTARLGLPAFQIAQEKKIVWSWPAPAALPREPIAEWLGPHMTKIYRIRWGQHDSRGQTVTPGDYTLACRFPPPKGKTDGASLSALFAITTAPALPASPHLAPVAGLQTSLATDQPSYRPGEPVKIKLTLTNTTAAPLQFNSRNAQKFDFVIRSKNRLVWRWSAGKMFAQMLSSWQIPPGQSVTYEAVWEQKDLSNKPAPPGEYSLTGWQIGGGRAQAGFSIR